MIEILFSFSILSASISILIVKYLVFKEFICKRARTTCKYIFKLFISFKIE